MAHPVPFLMGMHTKVGESACLGSDHVFFVVILANARMTASGERHAYFERIKSEPAMQEDDGARRHITCQIRK